MSLLAEDVGVSPGASVLDGLRDRRRGRQMWLAAGILTVSVTIAFFHFYSTYFGQAEAHLHRSTHLALMLVLGFLVFPLGRKGFSAPLTWHFGVDAAVIALVIGTQIYTLVHIDRFLDIGYTAHTADIVLGTLLILAVLEATRRTVGWGLTATGIFFLVQTWQTDKFFWIFYGPPTPWWTMVEGFFGKEDGLYGIPVGIMSSVLILFIFFSTLLAATGIGDFFVKLATALAGRLAGGPAKISVFSSALFGTISGSGVANVMVDGVFTIPMMKRAGYGATFAAAVEATASIGGLLMPPIMAAAAFIMADFVGVPFRQVALAALIPAVLYFLCVFVTVHFEAKRLNLSPVPRANMPTVRATLREDGYLLLPIAVLVWYLYQGYSEEMAGLMAIGATFLISFVRRRSALTPDRLLAALESGARTAVTVAMAVATAGLIIGGLFLSGIGLKFSYILLTLSGGQLWLALVYTAFAGFILGLSLPATGVYLTLAVVVAPGLVAMGVPKMAAHMFVFYMGVTGDLTPPTCLSPFAAASIAGSPPMATAWRAMRLGAVLYIVPFMFVYSPALLLIGSPAEIAIASATAALGILCLAAALQGWLLRATKRWERAALGAAAIVLIIPGIYTAAVGLGLMALVGAVQFNSKPEEVRRGTIARSLG